MIRAREDDARTFHHVALEKIQLVGTDVPPDASQNREVQEAAENTPNNANGFRVTFKTNFAPAPVPGPIAQEYPQEKVREEI